MAYKDELYHIRIGKLISKELLGTITDAEQQELNVFVNEHESNQAIYSALHNEYEREVLLSQINTVEGEIAFERFRAKIGKITPKGAKPWKWLAAAAAVLFIAAVTIFLYDRQPVEKLQGEYTKTIQDVAPGGNRATLKLGNGKIINLDNLSAGAAMNDDGVTITKTTDGEIEYTITENAGAGGSYNTVTTPLGGKYQLRLPDETKVWLNTGSSLTYLTKFMGHRSGKRKVVLSGEAYFEVAKDAAHPFIVETRGQEIEVLGTHFNVNSYENENLVRTTLLEGLVRIHPLKPGVGNKTIKPGQQASLSSAGLTIMEVDLEQAVAWKNGIFQFQDTDIPTVMRQISRWYNLNVQYSGAIPKDKITGGIPMDSNLTTVLKMLELVNVRYKIVETANGKVLIINP